MPMQFLQKVLSISPIVYSFDFCLIIVRTTSDASLDSRFLIDAADLGVEKVHKLPLLASEFSLDRYLGLMKEYLGSHSWADLGNLVCTYWAGVETIDFM